MKNCIICNNEFTSAHGNTKTCTPECSLILKRKKNNERNKLYHKTEKGKNSILKAKDKYNLSENGKEKNRERWNRKSARRLASGQFHGWDFNTWSTKVKQNWNNICAECSSTEKLEAHHIFSRKDFPEFASLITNGICLCRKCHINLHRILRESL